MSRVTDRAKQKQHYLRLWDEADKILKQSDNPCQIKAVGDGMFTCAGRAEPNTTPSKQLCCVGCSHHSPTGCTVKALGCKLGWCWASSRCITGQKVEDHPTFIAISKLRDEAIALSVPLHGRNSFEQIFPEEAK